MNTENEPEDAGDLRGAIAQAFIYMAAHQITRIQLTRAGSTTRDVKVITNIDVSEWHGPQVSPLLPPPQSSGILADLTDLTDPSEAGLGGVFYVRAPQRSAPSARFALSKLLDYMRRRDLKSINISLRRIALATTAADTPSRPLIAYALSDNARPEGDGLEGVIVVY